MHVFFIFLKGNFIKTEKILVFLHQTFLRIKNVKKRACYLHSEGNFWNIILVLCRDLMVWGKMAQKIIAKSI